MLADAAPAEPEKVQVVAFFTSAADGGAVGAGPATGDAATDATRATSREQERGSVWENMTKE